MAFPPPAEEAPEVAEVPAVLVAAAGLVGVVARVAAIRPRPPLNQVAAEQAAVTALPEPYLHRREMPR